MHEYSLCVCVCVSVCLFVCLSVCLSLPACRCGYVYVRVCVCICNKLKLAGLLYACIFIKITIALSLWQFSVRVVVGDVWRREMPTVSIPHWCVMDCRSVAMAPMRRIALVRERGRREGGREGGRRERGRGREGEGRREEVEGEESRNTSLYSPT